LAAIACWLFHPLSPDLFSHWLQVLFLLVKVFVPLPLMTGKKAADIS
jgi:hypothetical protein